MKNGEGLVSINAYGLADEVDVGKVGNPPKVGCEDVEP